MPYPPHSTCLASESEVLPYLFNNTHNYADVRQACKDLFNKSINLAKLDAPKGTFHRAHLVSELKLIPGSGRIRGSFTPVIQPYLLQFTTAGNFTRADIATLLTLSPNAQRLYWYLKSFANMGSSPTVKQSIGIEKLKVRWSS